MSARISADAVINCNVSMDKYGCINKLHNVGYKYSDGKEKLQLVFTEVAA